MAGCGAGFALVRVNRKDGVRMEAVIVAKKKHSEGINWHPDANAHAMQLELQSWIETHELTHDTK
jgi:gamma-glutamyl-gamma-aminobutyrate hydrolase PuuD